MQLVLATREDIVVFEVATILMYWSAKAIPSWLFPLGTPLYGGVTSAVPEASQSVSEFLWRIWAPRPRWEILFHLLWLNNIIRSTLHAQGSHFKRNYHVACVFMFLFEPVT